MKEYKNLTTYNPKEIEQQWYRYWEEKGYFHEEVDTEKEPFSIVLPPPNVTGQLHMGHALDNTLQDILIRTKRMQGYNVLWMPGTDHAGIATQVKVEENIMKTEGKSRHDLGREEFLKRVWEWKQEYGSTIVKQIRSLGASCDWTRERFTLDEGYHEAVLKVFVELYEKGLIYRGERITNWCPNCLTALSDIEVEHEDENGHLWHIKYPVIGEENTFLTVATTRPETMFGDVAVAVNPNDERYAHLVGKELLLPFVNRHIPIIADEYVDQSFGTGCVKITPAHDPNDFEMGQRHNLESIVVMNPDGTMNAGAGHFVNMPRELARKQVVAELEAQGLLEKVEEHGHSVGHCSRCNTTVEPMVSKQWFVSMEPLAKPALEVVRDKSIEFVPERFTKTYTNWLESIRDWCISRQLWWGHRIPAWYCQDCGETIVTTETLAECPHCHGKVEQDPDVLDTWFSSALWPFATMGWPDNTEEVKHWYPTSVMVTGYDIIFFWVARMIFMGLEFKEEIPFKHVFIHGLVRDSQGRKMSKSLGNGINPLEVIEEYGADALRFTLVTGNTPGNDMRFYMERVEANRNFANKIWNASKFVLMNLEGFDESFVPSAEDYTLADKWILEEYNKTVTNITNNLDKFELGEAASAVYDFIWNTYCDWYIELAKPRLYNKEGGRDRQTVQYLLVSILRHMMELLHPFMPFVTEHIWQHLPHEGESIMVAPWPSTLSMEGFSSAAAHMNVMMDGIKGIRNMRAEMNVPMGKRSEVILVPATEELKGILETHGDYFHTLGWAEKVTVLSPDAPKPENATVTVVNGLEVYLLLKDLIDADKEKERIAKEQATVLKEIARLEGKLNNQGFLAKAPEAVVAKEKEKLEEYKQKQQALNEREEFLKTLA
ncbi:MULTISPECIES: valine--tRNA ligase [unclassified Veillonella]|uniref:valine--tRNA ligase n=1 Tax=unclassified Veillonella TaxID=2630086 RepID=UPI000F8EC066|nr:MULTISPECIES: valine--tRNA ligase [unclassified Veillonella]